MVSRTCLHFATVLCDHRIILYLEYQSVCPFVRIGSTRPLSRKRVCPPSPRTKGRRQPSLSGEGAGGANSDDWRESLALCILCACDVVYYNLMVQ
jgi:hypothetical protein